MKKIFLFAVASAVVTLLYSCGKENVEPTPEVVDPVTVIDYSGPSFRVAFADMRQEGDSKAIFHTQDYMKLVYENNDRIMVNGHEFVLHYVGDSWRAYATSSAGMTNDTLYGSSFACFYGKSPATELPVGSDAYSNVSFVGGEYSDADRSAFKHYTSGIVLAGTTTDSLITLYPTFAVIRVARGAMAQQFTLDHLSFGFDANKVVKKGTVVPQAGTYPAITGSPTYMTGVTHSSRPNPFTGAPMDVYSGDFLDANTADQDHGESTYEYHVLVPLASNSVTTNIYIKTKMMLDGETYLSYKKLEDVTLERGVVYTFDVFDETH